MKLAKLAISIARKMNALIFLVPEDIVDVRSRLVCTYLCMICSFAMWYSLTSPTDHDVRGQLDGDRVTISTYLISDCRIVSFFIV